MVVCQQREWADGNWSLAAEPPSGQLNPINDRVYEVRHNHLTTAAITLMNRAVKFSHVLTLFILFSLC